MLLGYDNSDKASLLSKKESSVSSFILKQDSTDKNCNLDEPSQKDDCQSSFAVALSEVQDASSDHESLSVKIDKNENAPSSILGKRAPVYIIDLPTTGKRPNLVDLPTLPRINLTPAAINLNRDSTSQISHSSGQSQSSTPRKSMIALINYAQSRKASINSDMQVPPVKSLSGMGFSSVFKRTFDSNSENQNFASGLVSQNNYEKISA